MGNSILADEDRAGFVVTDVDGASLILALDGASRWTLRYRPSSKAVEQAVAIAGSAGEIFEVPSELLVLVEGDGASNRLVTHPLNTNANSRAFLRPKYPRLRTITFERFSFERPEEIESAIELLGGLPTGFVKSPYHGLGMNWELRYLTDAIEKAGVDDLCVRTGRRKGLPIVESGSYVLSASMFDDARRAINRAHDRALGIAAIEKRIYAHNSLLTPLDAGKFPEQERGYKKNAIVGAIGKSLERSVTLSPADRNTVVRATRSAVPHLSKTKPTELLELGREIEVVSLEALIERLRDKLAKKLNEGAWQSFLRENSFVLRLAFGYPIVMIGEQISVGGRTFDGTGDKLSDFAVKAAATGNMALIEIKTADTPLVEAKPYRRGLHGPARELAAAVNQVLDQRYQLQRNIHSLKGNSGAWDVESYAVQCLVVAGRMPPAADMQKSFELYRHSLKSVTVVTFDEFLTKLEQLHAFLRAPADAKN